MGDQRSGGISWTDETWNPIRGCRRVNTDCINCYAERLAATRLLDTPAYRGLAVMSNAGPRWTGKIAFDEATLMKPLAWKRPRMVFTNAMSDLFYEELPFEQIDRIVAVMALAANHTFQVLTKRPARMAAYLARLAQSVEPLEAAATSIGYTFNFQGIPMCRWPLNNVWWGASMGHQQAADEFMPHLLACRPNAKVLWISAEPLIGSVTFAAYLGSIDWIVAGGESGPSARPSHQDWFRLVRDQCLAADVPFHFKQWGEWAVTECEQGGDLGGLMRAGLVRIVRADREQDGHFRRGDVFMRRVGRKAAGAVLDGREWKEFPQ